MASSSIPSDTDEVAFDVQVERWRSMSIAERVELIDQMHADIEALALAGIVAEQPDLSAVGIRHELARRRYGAELADAAYRDLLG